MEAYEKQLLNVLKEMETVWMEKHPFITGEKMTIADVFAACDLEQMSMKRIYLNNLWMLIELLFYRNGRSRSFWESSQASGMVQEGSTFARAPFHGQSQICLQNRQYDLVHITYKSDFGAFKFVIFVCVLQIVLLMVHFLTFWVF